MGFPSTIFLGTNNAHKRAEIQALFPDTVRLITPAELFPDEEPPEETGTTLAENALLKARYFAQKSNLPTLSDDTGLLVAALNGAPGVYSARYAGPAADAAANVEKLLGALAGETNRNAHFETVMAFVMPDGTAETVVGRLDGTIAEAARGTHGFGYDPVFLPEGYTRTLAELSPAEKNQISHRSRALSALLAHLTEFFAR